MSVVQLDHETFLVTSEWKFDEQVCKVHLWRGPKIYEQVLRASDCIGSIPESQLEGLLLPCFENPEAIRLDFPVLQIVDSADGLTLVLVKNLKFVKEIDRQTFQRTLDGIQSGVETEERKMAQELDQQCQEVAHLEVELANNRSKDENLLEGFRQLINIANSAREHRGFHFDDIMENDSMRAEFMAYIERLALGRKLEPV